MSSKVVIVPFLPGIYGLESRINRVGNEVLDAIYRDMSRKAPVKVRNSPGPAGALKRSIRKRPAAFVQQSRRIYVGTDHWHFVEYGTKPHMIYPRYKQALYWPGAGYPRARVHHPGATANPFIRSSVYRSRQIRVIGGKVEVV